MKLYIKAKTNIKDLVIDYIEVILNNGRRVSLTWDESEIERTDEGFIAKYRGVYFGEEYANGCIDQLDPIGIADIGIYTDDNSEDPVALTITDMMFTDVVFGNAMTSSKEKTLNISDVFTTEDLSASVDLFDKTEEFIKEWLKKYSQYIDELRDEEDIVDDDGHIYDIGYDMKGDVEESDLNPFDEECRSENEEYGPMFDDWYDQFMYDVIVPILKNIHYNLNNESEESNNA